MNERAETLRWVASELEAQIEGLRQDRMRVLLSAGARARIDALSETAAMCRAEARKVNRKEASWPADVAKGKDTST